MRVITFAFAFWGLAACSEILGIDEATVVRQDASPSAPGRMDRSEAAAADGAATGPGGSADADAVAVADVGVDAGSGSIAVCDGGRCLIDCAARPADCSDGAVCPADRDCDVRCDRTSCPSVSCAPGRACVVSCLDGGCARVEIRGASASALCIDCGGCQHELRPGNPTFACRWDLACSSTTICR